MRKPVEIWVRDDRRRGAEMALYQVKGDRGRVQSLMTEEASWAGRSESVERFAAVLDVFGLFAAQLRNSLKPRRLDFFVRVEHVGHESIPLREPHAGLIELKELALDRH